MIEGLAEFIQMLERKAFGRFIVAPLLIVCALALAFTALHFIYIYGILPISHFGLAVIALFSGKQPRLTQSDVTFWAVETGVAAIIGAAFYAAVTWIFIWGNRLR